MWKVLQAPYFCTFATESPDLYHFGVTDFRRYWITNTSRKSFLAELKETNDGLEFDDEGELLQRGLDMVTNPEELQKVSVRQDENKKVLEVSMSKMYEITLKLELKMIEASADHFFDAIIQPLLKTVSDLRTSQRELRDLLIKKDKEIEEYKIEGRAPKRLITTLYDDEVHMKKHTAYEEYFNAPKVSELIEAAASCSRTKRKRPPSPQIAKPPPSPVHPKIKKSSQTSQEDVVNEIPSYAEETKIKNPEPVEVKSRKQRKRLNY